MIIRVVRMGFHPEKVEAFLKLFNGQKEKIRAFPGCTHLELWEEDPENAVFATYSHWESAQDLEKYRNSDLFGEVWPATKVLFNRRPEAKSYTRKMEVKGS